MPRCRDAPDRSVIQSRLTQVEDIVRTPCPWREPPTSSKCRGSTMASSWCICTIAKNNETDSYGFITHRGQWLDHAFVTHRVSFCNDFHVLSYWHPISWCPARGRYSSASTRGPGRRLKACAPTSRSLRTFADAIPYIHWTKPIIFRIALRLSSQAT